MEAYTNNYIDLALFKEMLEIDSTSGKEREFALFLASRLLQADCCGIQEASKCDVKQYEVGDGTLNLLFSWGKPRLYFCTHLDTVPPYIAPRFEHDKIYGRGSCDAKAQILSMYTTCRILEQQGISDFALLLLSGEETGSFGAKAYDRDCEGGELIIVGEPTDNKMVKASKGTKSFSINIKGKASHSGYPEYGKSAINIFIEFINKLNNIEFPIDDIMGQTTFNIGKLHSDNAQNVLSPELECKIYFRTTKASEDFVEQVMNDLEDENISIINNGGDKAMSYHCFDNIEQCVVSFGSDTPRLNKFHKRSLCGAGSILLAHTENEHILVKDLDIAIKQYLYMAKNFLIGEK